MDCLKRKKLSQNKVLEFVLHAMAYTMLDSGYDREEVLRICKKVDYVADSMADDYVTFTDIRKVMKEEYDYEINLI